MDLSGGVCPLTHSLTPAVPGLSFNATTRRLTGTPTTAGTLTAAGTFDMTYRVRDIDGDREFSDAIHIFERAGAMKAD